VWKRLQFSSRCYLCTRKRPYALHPISQNFSRCLWNGFNVRLNDNAPFKEDLTLLLSMPLLLVIDGVMSLVLHPQAPQHFRSSEKQATCEGCFARQSIPLVIFPSLRHVQGNTPTGVFEGGCWPLAHSSLGFHSTFHFFFSKLTETENSGICGLTVISWGNPAKGMGNCFYLHCQAGGSDWTGCTVFMVGSHGTLLDSEAPPRLVSGDWAIRIHYEVLRSAVFLNEKLDLCFACWPFLTVLSQVFWQKRLIEMPESVSVPFPLLGLSEFLQLAYLQNWVLCLPLPRLAPSQSASLCVFHGIMELVVGIFDSTEVWFDLLHFLSCLHWWEV